MAAIEEKHLERMEALLTHSALGVHVLFENRSIAEAMKSATDDSDLRDIEKMRKVQVVMTELISKKTFVEKQDYIKSLDRDSYRMLVRAYFHIVENTVRATQEFQH
ncbi:MAG: hypothetical protein N2578_03745 [Bdellovibrionaceae bacterium]|nr:hypothetical protein [Pseudobdellovibrionaceae bacterium]